MIGVLQLTSRLSTVYQINSKLKFNIDFLLTCELACASVTLSYLLPTTIILKSRWLKLSKIWSLMERQYCRQTWKAHTHTHTYNQTKGILATAFTTGVSVDLPEMFPNYPCRRLEHKRAPFAAPEDVHYSIQQSYQPEIASGEIAMPICWVFVFHQRRRQTQCVCMYECVCESVCVYQRCVLSLSVCIFVGYYLGPHMKNKYVGGREREREDGKWKNCVRYLKR